jgi:SAM-dependent methyltransferase
MIVDRLKRRFLDAMARVATDAARRETAPLHAALAQGGAAQDATVNRTLDMVRAEYTVMPRFAFHQPLDYLSDTFPPRFAPAIHVPGEALPLPPPERRGGYPKDDAEYLATGRNHQAVYLEQIERHLGLRRDLSVMELGCATGRVLRHFHTQKEELGWKLIGCDVQAEDIEWLRQNWPLDINVYVGSVFPKLPFEDNSIDVIYGMSVFTHIKYHWDFWLLELRRVLKPGGLLLQTIHAERAWRFYHDNQHLDWVRAAISPHVLASAEMNHDFLLSGDIAVSQTFFKQDVARRYWGRYLEVLEIVSPDDRYWFQDLMVCRK